MALVRELVRQGRRDLRLVGSAHGIDVDLLVGAGAAGIVEESYVGFEQDLGLAPAYRRAAESGGVVVRERCCYTLLQQLRAAEYGLPFMPVRGVAGTGIRELHPEYAEITCPFTGERLVAVPALAPDVALIHAPSADRRGNVHLGAPRARRALRRRLGAWSSTVEGIASTEEVAAAGIVVPYSWSTRWSRRRSAPIRPPAIRATPTTTRTCPRRSRRRATATAWPPTWTGTCARASPPTSTRVGRSSSRAGRASIEERQERFRWHEPTASFTIDEWIVRRAGAHDPRRRGGLPRLREPVRAGGDARRQAHARPHMLLVEGATYAVDPEPAFIPPTCNDLALHRDAVYVMRFEELFDAACRGAVDRMFLSGGQIDGYGNTNVTAVGGLAQAEDQARRRWRRLQHLGDDPRADAVDHPAPVRPDAGRGGSTTSPTSGTSRRRAPARSWATPAAGRQWLVTELGIFDYAADGHARLRASWPDVTVSDVRDATGFELRVELEHGLLHPPSSAELAAVRAVDPLGVRRSEFGPDELKRSFERDGEPACAC